LVDGVGPGPGARSIGARDSDRVSPWLSGDATDVQLFRAAARASTPS